MESLETINRQLFLALNAAEGISPFALEAAKLLANGLVFLAPALLAALWFWGGDARRAAALKAAVTAVFALGISFLIGHLWPHPRPFALGLGHAFFDHAPDASFPSDHATFLFAVGLGLLQKGTRRIGAAVLLAGLAVGWSRVFLGVHFPLDILGALAAAALAAGLVSALWREAGPGVTTLCVRLYRLLFAPLISRGWVRS